MADFFQGIGYLLLFFLSFGVLFFLLSLVGGATNTRYKIKGVGTIQPTKISNEAIEENINIVKSSFKKIGRNAYEKILVDIQTFLKKEKNISIQFARKYVFYGNIVYSGISTYSPDSKFEENLKKALTKAKENGEEDFLRNMLRDGSPFQQQIIVENIGAKIQYRKFDDIASKLSQILRTNQGTVELLLYSTNLENSFYIEEISNKIIAAYWKNKLTAGECKKLVEYIYLNYPAN